MFEIRSVSFILYLVYVLLMVNHYRKLCWFMLWCCTNCLVICCWIIHDRTSKNDGFGWT